MKLKYFLFILFSGLMVACKTPKDVIYFQGIDDLSEAQLDSLSQEYVTKITNDDLLSISVASWDPAAVTPFNPPVFAYSSEGDQPLFPSQSLYTYLVDQNGNIKFPVIGTIHVAGLTRLELASKMESLIAKYVEKPLVNVQILNFKVVVMGEVNRPGSYTVKNDRFTLLDAIGMAGDIPIMANRKNVLVIRDNDGKKVSYRMDLTSPDIFTSPAFYLQQNDIVYVEPVKTKQRMRSSSDRSFTLSIVSSLISAISLISSMAVTIVTIKDKK